MTRPDLLPSELLERYEPTRLLGEGGFGKVVEARDRQLGREVAIKLLSGGLGSAEQRARFEREARITAQLAHPHVVGVYEYGVADGDTPFIVYQHVRGADLDDLIRTRPSLERVERWAREIAAALAAAHEAGVVHRDMKTSNVLVREEDDGAVVCDFGLARVAEGKTLQTEEGVLLGTPRYMAPEIWKGAEPSAASDQFAWAATLYYVLGEESVYGADDVHGIVQRLKEYEGPPLSDLELSAPALARVMNRALSADPRERYPDMHAALRALDEEEDGLAVPGATRRPEPQPETPGSGARTGLGLGLLLLGLVGLGFMGEGPATAPRPAEQAVAIEDLWQEAERAQQDFVRHLGIREGPPWRVRLGPDSTWITARGLGDERTPLKWRRLMEKVLDWADAVRTSGGFRGQDLVRMQLARNLAQEFLSLYGSLGDEAFVHFQDREKARQIAASQMRRPEIRKETWRLLKEKLPEDLGPEGLPLAAFRLALAQDVAPDIPFEWFRSTMGSVTREADPVVAVALEGILAGYFRSSTGNTAARRGEVCRLREEIGEWVLRRVRDRRARGEGETSCTVLHHLRGAELHFLRHCAETAASRARYSRLLEETEACVPWYKERPGGGASQLEVERKFLDPVRGALGELPEDWTRRIERLRAELAP